MMQLTRLVLVSVLAIALAAENAFAAGGADAPLSSLFWPVANFGVYVCLLFVWYTTGFFGGKSGKVMLAERKKVIEAQLAKSSQTLAAAESEKAAIQARLDTFPAEREALLERYAAEAERMEQSIVEAAEQQARMLLQDTSRQIAMSYQQARSELRLAAVREAAARAEAHLRTGLTEEQDRELRKQFLREALLR